MVGRGVVARKSIGAIFALMVARGAVSSEDIVGVFPSRRV